MLAQGRPLSCFPVLFERKDGILSSILLTPQHLACIWAHQNCLLMEE